MIDQNERRQFIEQAKDTFTIPQPQAGITVRLMGVLVAVGLAALFVAAYTAFDKVMPSVQAIFAATLIEAALIVEALALIRGRNKLALAGLIISLSVSGIYNYIQVTAEASIKGITGWPLLIALSLGPLAALVSLSLALGDELRKHETAVAQWQEKRQAHVQNEVNRLVKNANSRQAGRQKIPARTRQETRHDNGNLPGDWRQLTRQQKRDLAHATREERENMMPELAARTRREWHKRADKIAGQNGQYAV